MTGQRRSRACDGCRIRKVKCDGAQPCSQCVHFDVSCIVSPANKRKNPIRGRLVAKVRGEEDSFNSAIKDASASPASPEGTRSSGADQISPVSATSGLFRGVSLYGSPRPAASVGYTPDFFISLIPQFEEIVYPLSPVISTENILDAIRNMDNSFEDAALVYAYGSATLYLTQPASTLFGGLSLQTDELLRLSLEAHKRADTKAGPDGRLTEEPSITLKRIMTCIYLEISTMVFKSFNRSFALLREGITMLQTLKVRQYSPTGQEAARYQRLYWEAFIHERFLTIASGYPSILPPLPSGFPDHDPALQPHVELGFNRIISLFTVMDRQFLAYWTEDDKDGSVPEIGIDWIERKQAQLDEDEIQAAEADNELRLRGRGALTELQVADLFVTRLWLRTIVWQIALSRGLLRSGPLDHSHEALSLHFPVQRLSHQLRTLVGRLESLTTISTQGSGILQKLFEITSTIGDVLALPVGHDQSGLDMSTQVKDFAFIVKCLFNLEYIKDQQRQYLREKLELLQQQYPSVANYSLT